MEKKFNFFIPFSKSPTFNSSNGFQYLDGVASTTDIDRDTERMSSKALDRITSTINSKGINLFMDHEHEWTNAIGLLESATKGLDNKTVHTKIRLEKSDSPMSPVPYLLDKLASGINLGLSVGGRVIQQHDEFDKAMNQKVGVIDDVELYEVSVVGIPSNPFCNLSIAGSIAKSAKSFYQDHFEEDTDPALFKSLGQMMRDDQIIYKTKEASSLRKEIGMPDSQVVSGSSAPIGHNITENNVCPGCKAARGEFMASRGSTQIYKCRACGEEYTKDVLSNDNISVGGAQPTRVTGREAGALVETLPKSAKPTLEKQFNPQEAVTHLREDKKTWRDLETLAGKEAKADEKLINKIKSEKNKDVPFNKGLLTKDELNKINKAVNSARQLLKDAEAQNDPYAICTAQLGEQGTPKWDRCVEHIQSQKEATMKTKDAEAEEQGEAEGEAESEAESKARPLKKPKFVKDDEPEEETESTEKAEESEEETEEETEGEEESEDETEKDSPGEESESGAERPTNTLTPGFSTPSGPQYQTQAPGIPGTGRGVGTIQDVPPQHPLKSAKVSLTKTVSIDRLIEKKVNEKFKELLNRPSLIKAMSDNIGPETIEPAQAENLEKKMKFRP